MSVVTNVIVSGLNLTSLIEVINGYLRSNELGELKEISEHAGGRKNLETELWVGAFNYLEIDEFVAAYKQSLSKVRYPEYVQLLMKRQDDDHFHHIDNRVPKSFHYRDARQDVVVPSSDPPEPPKPSSERGWRPGGVPLSGDTPEE